jgi:hypothetical protein
VGKILEDGRGIKNDEETNVSTITFCATLILRSCLFVLFRREYYERNNSLIQQFLYIDRLLDSSLPHDLLNEYNSSSAQIEVPPTITEESQSANLEASGASTPENDSANPGKKLKRTPRDLYKVPSETTPLFEESDDEYNGPEPEIPGMEDNSVESGDKIVMFAIYLNLAANTILLIGKIAVIVLTSM